MRAPIAWGSAPRSRVILACLAMLIAAPAAARAQAGAPPVSRPDADARLAARLDQETAQQVALLLDSARQARLPVEPLVDKALEGASKRAPGPRILDAVRRLSSELAESRRILGPQASPEEVTAGAHALRAKLAPAALQRLYEKRGRTTITASLGVYQELVALRVSHDTAAAAMLTLHRAGVSTQQIAEYQNEVARDIAVGGEPAMVAATTANRLAGDALGVTNNLPGTYNAAGGESGTSTRTKRKP